MTPSMKSSVSRLLPIVAMLLSAVAGFAANPYEGWQRSGALTILTTPEGANLPAAASVEGFPLQVRLRTDWFDFAQAKANGEDIRFSSSTGAPLAYQIEEWDAAKGAAGIWVRIPTIKGNARQEIRLHWGKADAVSESSGAAVFNESNGYLSVWHMSGPVKDEVGTLESKDAGTTSSVGMIGEARISKVARSADWVRLQFENQKPQQTLVGHLVRPGNIFSVSHESVNVLEGKSVTVSAEAGGARNEGDGGEGCRRLEDGVERVAFRGDPGNRAGETHPHARAEQRHADGDSNGEQRRQTGHADRDHRGHGTEARRVGDSHAGEGRERRKSGVGLVGHGAGQAAARKPEGSHFHPQCRGRRNPD